MHLWIASQGQLGCSLGYQTLFGDVAAIVIGHGFRLELYRLRNSIHHAMTDRLKFARHDILASIIMCFIANELFLLINVVHYEVCIQASVAATKLQEACVFSPVMERSLRDGVLLVARSNC